MIDNYLILLFSMLSVITITFIIWLMGHLLDIAEERDEWRERAVDTNAVLQEMEQIRYYEDILSPTAYRNEGLRPYRTNTQLNWGKSMREWHSSLNPNKGD